MTTDAIPLVDETLTPKEEAFAYHTATLYNQTEAYLRVYVVDEKRTARDQVAKWASELAHKPHVKKRIKELKMAAADASIARAADVVRDWMDIAEADPAELIQQRIGCCRHCHGDGYQYQWRDEQEWALAIAHAIDAYDPKKDPEGKGPNMPDNLGGFGFSANIAPDEHCPRCDGRGVPFTIITDTTKLSGPARRLYAGVKVTRDGLQVLMRDQDKALENIARTLGMFQDNVNVKGKLAHANVTPNELDEKQRAALDEFFSSSF